MTVHQTQLFLTKFFLLFLATRLAEGQGSCYNNPIPCVNGMRQLLLDPDMFWFGTDYVTSCPSDQTTPECDNPDKGHYSVASRLFSLNDTTNKNDLTGLLRTIKLAFVTYNAPAGIVQACDSDFSISPVTNHLIDPLNVTFLSSWSLVNPPAVGWDMARGQSLYSVLIWDVGTFQLHGLYVNCQKGAMDSGIPVVNYKGPMNPFPRTNPTLVVVYPQKLPLNQSDVSSTVATIKQRHGGRFVPAELFTSLSSSLTNKPSHINIINLMADPYSIQLEKETDSVDNCPHLIAQKPTFQKLLTSTNITVRLRKTDLGSEPDYTTLSVTINVEYSTNDFETEYCCTKYSVPRTVYRVNAFNETPIHAAIARIVPKIHLAPMNMKDRQLLKNNLYTLLMVDVAPSVEGGLSDPPFYTHWLVTNIRDGEVTTGDELSPYFGPNPIVPDAPRTYMFLLYKQPVSRLNNSVIDDFCPAGRWICQIHLKPVLEAWNLTELVGVTWFNAVHDGFAKMRIYSVLKMETMDEVCKGVKGYNSTCAITTTVSTNSSRGTSTLSSHSYIHTTSQAPTSTVAYTPVGSVTAMNRGANTYSTASPDSSTSVSRNNNSANLNTTPAIFMQLLSIVILLVKSLFQL